MTKLQEERANFTRSNAFIRESRESKFYYRSATAILLNLQRKAKAKKDNSALRALSREMVEAGYYSPKIALAAVDLMIAKKLWKATESQLPWKAFAATIAPEWGNK